MLKRVTTVILLLTLFSFNLLSVNAQEVESKGISMEKAKQIALGQVKGEILNAYLQDDDGKSKYEIIIQAKDGKYEVEIDKSTGKVLEVEREGNKGDRDDDDDDDERYDD
ncbi:PepSY domain-containing protein [Schinkia azotoformans]|uniref:PepSY domain-containing protein n=1 Tax=Schinkia azotoformans TaxID=1454 RepID=UPI002DBB098A|nr:PepSY domain-containing protein [Schinkia azotoformans]MEC1722048.1 PepSY domain-containing protein [Schinkia azotoformans]MED4354187.1 PepSY domain-containing protein [Schinkia azotoformans]MED4415247.1 PepSY domain-containing protein [Schinkia azotoformans]